MNYLRRISDRNQLTIPPSVLKAVGADEPHALFTVEAQNGRIVLEPKKISTQDLSAEDWDKLDRLVKKQTSGKHYTQYDGPQKAKKHLARYSK
jgi:hypothetical protein